MKRIVAVLALLLPVVFIACQTSDYDEPSSTPYPRGGRGGYGGGEEGDREQPRFARGGGAVLDMLPPNDWWREPQLATAVNITADEVAALTKLEADQNEIDKIERDSTVAVDDLRKLLASDQPSVADITAAGGRLRDMRNSLFDRQVGLLAAERTILTKAQWQTLQDQLHAMRSQRGRDRGGYPGGRGGFPRGGGRRPGFP